MDKFWLNTPLDQMSDAQWESLCDGCARCCMIKLEDEDDGEVYYTAVVCDLLDIQACRCRQYPQRHTLVPDCVVLTPERAGSFHWLPTTCAYRIVAQGGDLEWWHPLVSGSASTVHEAGISVQDKVVSQASVPADAQQDMIVRWVEQ